MDFEEFPYVSCIRIGKRSILPPVMTDERRAEMRYYRELAITLEKHQTLRKKKRFSTDSGVIVSNFDGSIDRKTADCDPSDFVDVEKSPIVKSDVYTDMVEDSCAAKSDIIIIMDDSSITDGSMIEHDTPSRKRRDSYTLETPSPIMLQYMKANEKYDELLIEMEDSSDCSTVVNEELSASNTVKEYYPNGMTLQTGQLTLQDLEKRSEPKNATESWNMDECTFGCNDIEQFVMNAKRLKAFSLPNSSVSSPFCPSKMSMSDSGLKVEYDNLLKNEPAANFSKHGDALEDYKMSETNKTSEANENHFYINDDVSKYVELLDLNDSADMSLESEMFGRESSYSDCSSVSLSKFLVDGKVANSQESTDLNDYLHMKEQLELKHRNELMKLLREQEKENNLLEQFVRVSDTSSPKSNYAYSKEVVLKKYSAENSPSPILSKHSPEGDTPRFSRASNCRRRICDDESEKLNQVDSYSVPVITVSNSENSDSIHSIHSFEVRVHAATKINAAVRGYFVRRLFKTSRVQHLLQTINDCLITAISLQKESDLKPAELSLQSRVLQQSITAQNEIHEIFALPTVKQLEIIATDRDLKNRSLLRKSRTPLPLSEATQKTIERRKSLNFDSRSPKNVVRKRCKSVSSIRSDSNVKCQNISNRSKTKTKLSHNYTVPHCGRRFWR